MVSDDESDQSVTQEAFEILHFIAAKRLATGKLTVIDATNVKSEDRKSLLALAREYHVLSAAIVFNLPEKRCHERNQLRPNRQFGPHVVRQQRADLKRSLRYLKREGFKHVTIFESLEEVEAAEVKRQPLWNNLKAEQGPFDIIGDVHGCFDELIELLDTLGYETIPPNPVWKVTHPEGRKLIFLGDLVDRGPKTPEVLRLVMDMVASGIAFCIPGNHDVKLMRKLKGKNVKLTHGLAESVQQLENDSPEFHQQVIAFLDNLISHYLFDGGKLLVAHAGMPEVLEPVQYLFRSKEIKAKTTI